MNMSETYKTTDINDINRLAVSATNTPNLMSETFYKQDKGSETADYSYNYQVGTLNIKSTSVFFYGTNLERAFETDPEEAMSRSLGYKWGKTVTDEIAFYNYDPLTSTYSIADLVQLTSETYYFGAIKGEETADYSYNYQVGTLNIKSTSVFFYGDSLERAFETDPEEAMSRSLGYKWGKTVTDEIAFYNYDPLTSTYSIADLVQLTSETYYFGAIKGEEIANYAYNYQTKKDSSDAYIASTAKTTSVYYYDSRRATDPAVTSETAMNMSETYKVIDILDINRLPVTATNTPNLMSETFYRQDKGSETADYSYNYQVGTLNIKSTSVFFYGDSLERAFETDPDAPMSRSLGYKRGKSVTDETVFYLVDKSIADLVQLTSETYYFGDIKGEEIANYAYNYQTKKDSSDAYIASTAKTTSVYYYDSRRATDPLVTSETAMNLSETYKVIDIDLIERRDDVPGVDLNGDGDYLDAGEAAPIDYVQNLMSETFYKQDKGSETADYSYNYQVGTLNIKSTSVFFYGDSLERAFETDPEEAMSRSLGYKWGKSVTDETI